MKHAVFGEKSVEVLGARGPRGEEALQSALGRFQLRDHAVDGRLGDALDVARVLVVVAHERLDARQHVFLRIFQTRGDLPLQIKRERIDRTLVDEVHLGADAQEKVISFLEQLAFALAEKFFLDELGRGVGPGAHGADPQQVLVIAQAAHAVFDVRLLHGNDAAVLLVQFPLVDQAPREVGVGFAFDAFSFELGAEFLEHLAVAAEAARFEHRRLGLQVLVGLRHGLGHGADGVADFEADVPKHAGDFLHRHRLLRRGFASAVEKHDVHIAEGIHLAPAVSAVGRGGEAVGLGLSDCFGADLSEEPAEKDIDQIAALPHDLASARAGGNTQAQAVLFQPPESLVGGERFRRGAAFGLPLEIVAGAAENGFEVVAHGVRPTRSTAHRCLRAMHARDLWSAECCHRFVGGEADATVECSGAVPGAESRKLPNLPGAHSASAVGAENDNLHAAVELLLFDGAFGRDEGFGAAQPARVDARGADTHVLREPALHRFGAGEAEFRVVFRSAERIGVALDAEPRLRVAAQQLAEFLQAGHRLGAEK